MEQKSKNIGLKRIWRQTNAIGVVTFRELLREKILWSGMVFALLSVALAFAASGLSFADNARVALSFGLTSISLVGGGISILMGGTLIAREIQNRTAYLILTKAIWRWQFVVGKVLGLMAVLALNMFIMVLALFVVYFATGGSWQVDIFKCFILQFTEFGVLAAIACIFSSFSTSTLASILTVGIWIIGHAMSDLEILIEKISSEWLHTVLMVVSGLLPDLTKFDIKSMVIHQLPVAWSMIGLNLLYGMVFIAFALASACLIFSRRDL